MSLSWSLILKEEERKKESMEYKLSNIENTLKGKNINYLIIEISYQENNTLSLVLFAVNDLRKSNNERCQSPVYIRI